MNYRHLTTDIPIHVYSNLKEIIVTAICCSLFIALGLYMIDFPHSAGSPEILPKIIGTASLLLGGLGIFICILRFARRRAGKPICLIYSDRIEQFAIQKKRQRETVFFRDINQFIVWKLMDNKFIRGVRHDGSFVDTVLNTSNVENIDDVCEMLNRRLENYHNTSYLDTPEKRMRF